MFKNETHNRNGEIEPFGGAATIGGGPFVTRVRSFICYQAMRISGAGDITAPIAENSLVSTQQ